MKRMRSMWIHIRASEREYPVFYSVCCICCLSRRDSRGWDAMAYPRPACLGGEMLGLAYARRCYARDSFSLVCVSWCEYNNSLYD